MWRRRRGDLSTQCDFEVHSDTPWALRFKGLLWIGFFPCVSDDDNLVGFGQKHPKSTTSTQQQEGTGVTTILRQQPLKVCCWESVSYQQCPEISCLNVLQGPRVRKWPCEPGSHKFFQSTQSVAHFQEEQFLLLLKILNTWLCLFLHNIYLVPKWIKVPNTQ